METRITKELFESFVEVQDSGICNMMDFQTVSFETGCTKEEHREMLRNYKKYAQEFGVGL